MCRSCDDDRWREPGYRWNNGGSERFPQIGLLYDLAMNVLHSVQEIIYLGFNADRSDALIVNFSEEVGRWRTQTSHDFGLERCRTSKFSHLNDVLSVLHSIQEINYLAVVRRSRRRPKKLVAPRDQWYNLYAMLSILGGEDNTLSGLPKSHHGWQAVTKPFLPFEKIGFMKVLHTIQNMNYLAAIWQRGWPGWQWRLTYYHFLHRWGVAWCRTLKLSYLSSRCLTVSQHVHICFQTMKLWQNRCLCE
jgi:hypothetical protein